MSVRTATMRALVSASALCVGIGCTAPLTVDRADDVATATACIEGVPDDCSLRGAILNANHRPGPDTIVVPYGTYLLTAEGSDEDDGLSGDLDIQDALSITGVPDGSGARPTIQGQRDRVIDVGSGAIGLDVSLADLSVASGQLEDRAEPAIESGGGILNRGASLTLTDCEVTDSQAPASGGGIYNAGQLYLLRSAIRRSSATSGPGGGLANDGTVVVQESEISDNLAWCYAGGVGYAGGLWNGATGEVRVLRSTLAHNHLVPFYGYLQSFCHGAGIASWGTLDVEASTLRDNSIEASILAPLTSRGGAIASQGVLSILDSTFSGNAIPGPVYGVDDSGGAIWTTGPASITHATFASNTDPTIAVTGAGSVTIANTLVAGTCDATAVVGLGGNLESPGDTCQLDGASDQVGVADPGIGPLASYGGPTQTIALLAGSPAIDAGTAASCLPTDQRGEPRTDGHCDTGAFERQAGDP